LSIYGRRMTKNGSFVIDTRRRWAPGFRSQLWFGRAEKINRLR